MSGSILTGEPSGRVTIIDHLASDEGAAVTSFLREDVVKIHTDLTVGYPLIALTMRYGARIAMINAGSPDDTRALRASIVEESGDVVWTITREGATRVPDAAR